jgi:hypothetical protein
MLVSFGLLSIILLQASGELENRVIQLNTDYTVTQTTDWAYFDLDIPSKYNGMYLIIEYTAASAPQQA